jgi:outer membrane protein OmpA-like peptidoglycan-associated protein
MRRLAMLILLIVLSVTLATSCATKRGTGAAVGAGAGAAIGAAIGSRSGDTAVGALLGAVVGGAAGAYIGNYMDKQAAELDRELENATVERVGEGIKVTFQSGILFDVDRAELRPAARENISELAGVLQKYDQTDVIIEGHTDATGSEEHNFDLSRRRAMAVANFLSGAGVDPTRFSILAYGETQPVATNETPEGRQANRRVNLAIMANEELREAAERKAG